MYALSGQAECPDQGSPDGPARPIRGAESTAKLVINMVGTTGLEPATSSVSRKRSNQLSYAPAKQYLAVYQDRGGRERRVPLAGGMLYHRSLTKNRCSRGTALTPD
jgi:hypothetical protein